MKRILIILLLLVVVGAGAYYFYQRSVQARQDLTSQYQTESAERGNLVASIGATGVVRSNQTALLNWQTTGVVESVEAQVGEQTQAQQTLASLSQTSLPQNVILAEAELANARQALDDLYVNADVARVKAMQEIVAYERAVRDAQYQLDNFTIPTAQADMDAVEALAAMKQRLDEARSAFEPYKYASSNDPKREELKEALDLAQADYNTAVKRLGYEYNLEVAQSNLEKAQTDYARWKEGPGEENIAAAEARLAAAQATLDLAHLAAPFAGTVTKVNLKPGDRVAPGSLAFQIDDLSRLLVDVNISEVDINQVREGQEVLLTFDAIPSKEYHGKISQVDQVGSSVQGLVEFLITVELTDADENVKPGMTAAVNVVTQEKQDVLLVPNRAVRIIDGNYIVYVLRDGQLVQVPVTLGQSSETMSEVVGGELQEGDAIVLNPPANLDSNGPPGFMRGGQ
jgi:HlyD family secretion protein